MYDDNVIQSFDIREKEIEMEVSHLRFPGSQRPKKKILFLSLVGLTITNQAKQ